jgi:hypothetical protein
MRPKILSHYKNEALEEMLKNSNSGELWIARFSPLPWGGIEKGNAAILYKKNGFFDTETITTDEPKESDSESESESTTNKHEDMTNNLTL